MEQTKKSFLLYFDMHPHLKNLSDSQRGMLFSALYDYALQEAERTGHGDAILQEYPDMAPETRMAFSFMAAVIRRDTEKWREKHLRYQKAALERHGKTSSTDDEIAKYMRQMYRNSQPNGGA